MIIDTTHNHPVTTETTPKKSRREPQASVPFDEILGGRATSSQRDAAAAAAEMMRLEMMRSAFTLGDMEGVENPPGAGRAVELILKAFAENDRPQSPQTLPESPSTTAPSLHSAPSTGNGGTPFDDIVLRASRRYGVDEGLIKAVIKAESNFNPRAVSPVGAQGLMQLMPSTARMLGVTDSFDPEQNIMAGTKFLADLLSRYGGDLDKALAAYNWGPGNVDRKPHLLPRETRDYLAKVKGYYSQLA